MLISVAGIGPKLAVNVLSGIGPEELLKATADQTGERIAAARGKAEKSVKAAKGRLGEQEAAVMARTKAVARATEDFVRDNPWKAMGIAAVAGLALGILAQRR